MAKNFMKFSSLELPFAGKSCWSDRLLKVWLLTNGWLRRELHKLNYDIQEPVELDSVPVARRCSGNGLFLDAMDWSFI